MTDSQKLDYLVENVGLIAQETLALRRDVTELKGRMTSLEQRMTSLEREVADLKERMTSLERDVAILKEDVADLKEDVASLKERMTSMEQDVADLRQNIAHIRMYQENVFEPNLKKVAEGHLDLSRRLREASKISDEEEMLHLRVNALEGDMKHVKEKLALA